jgi:protein-S-isoprenylcysteine O-methyltransferase Ste14
MTSALSAPNRGPWPVVIYILAIAIGIVLTVAIPLPWIEGPLHDILFAAGWLLVAAGVALDITAIRTLARAKTTIMPHRAAEHLVTSGPFSFTRNPIYLGNTTLTLGIGLIAGSLWFLVTALLAAFLTQVVTIVHEEKYLKARFGKKYHDYAHRVRRWI